MFRNLQEFAVVIRLTSVKIRARRKTDLRRGGRAVECTGLENRQGFIALRGFESHPLRQNNKTPLWGFLFLGRVVLI